VSQFASAVGSRAMQRKIKIHQRITSTKKEKSNCSGKQEKSTFALI
jgi:hypothetical protein